MPDVWFATCSRYPELPADESHLVAALRRRGVEVAPACWNDPAVDWSAARLCLPRATWDYSWHLTEFLAWVEAAGERTTLLNSPATLRWNAHKRYLAQLAAAGVPTLPTIHLERGSRPDLERLVQRAGWDEFVLKPAVAQTARETIRLRTSELARGIEHVERLLPAEDLLLQRFEPGILEHGERSLLYADGVLTHAVEKRAAAGDWRVQDDYGGTSRQVEPTADERAAASAALAALAEVPLYARVDLVRDAAGSSRVIELELIEPALFFGDCPGSAEPYAEAICRRVSRGLTGAMTE